MDTYETLFILEPIKIVMLLATIKDLGFVIKRKTYGYFCVLLAVNILLLYTPLSLKENNDIFEFIISIAVIYFSITFTGLENIKINLCILCTLILLDQVTINLISLFFISDYSIFVPQINVSSIHYIIDFILILMLYKIKMSKKTFNYVPYINVSKLNCIILIIITYIFNFLINQKHIFSSDYYFIIEKLSLYFLVYIFIITFWSIIVIGSFKEYYRDTMEYKDVCYGLEKRMFMEKSRKDENNRKFLHDFKNHLICIEYLIKNKKIDEVEKYIKSIRNEIYQNKVEKRIGISAIDAVLCSLEMELPQNTKIQWKGELSEDIGISTFDLCVVYSNLFTNAIEAVAKIEDKNNRNISVITKVVTDILYIKVENSLDSGVPIKGNILTTTKRQKEFHGYGSINIKTCVQKYNGTIEYRCINNVFISEVFMKIPLSQ